MEKLKDTPRTQGDLDEELRVLREEQLPVYERSGDVRNTALTLGKIADILRARGEMDEALDLYEQRLAINRSVEDSEGIADTLWSIAQIELSRGVDKEAVPKIVEAYGIMDRMGRLEGIAVIGVVLGQILLRAGRRREGFEVLSRSEAGFRELGDPDSADRVAAFIEQIEGGEE